MNTAVAEQSTETAPPIPTLSFTPCDGEKACRARAYYFATVNDTVLSYCAHHGTKYEVGLLAKSTKVVDLRYMVSP